MDTDIDRVDETVLALMQLGIHCNNRAWKGFDHDAMNRLYEKGLIDFPFGKAKSVTLTETGMRQSKELFVKLFTNGTSCALPMEKDFASDLAKTVVCLAFRNTLLEELHSGTIPDSKTGDYSDVKVVTPYGEIPWVRTPNANKLSRLDEDEMRLLMQEAVNKVFTILLRMGNPEQLACIMKQAAFKVSQWDAPEELTDWGTGVSEAETH